MTLEDLQAWIGRRETVSEDIGAEQAARMAALLDVPETPTRGTPLPALWHWAYLTPTTPHRQIGADGHAKLGGFLPPVPLPRRMWAGGRLRFHQPILIGERISRESEVVSLEQKNGRQGALYFLTVRHRLTGETGLAIEEEQDIVYRGASVTPMPRPRDGEPETADWRDGLEPSAPFLFRYSALTFNAHRIHYDLPYAIAEEGYPGLVVHGPLTATLLAKALISRTPGTLATFNFRGQAPLLAGHEMHLCGRAEGGDYALWAEGPGGYVAMSAGATLAA